MQCNELMMTKFGRFVDLEALQMLSGSRRLEELKYEKLLKEATHAKEIKLWDVCHWCMCSSEPLQKIYIFVFFLFLLWNLGKGRGGASSFDGSDQAQH